MKNRRKISRWVLLPLILFVFCLAGILSLQHPKVQTMIAKHFARSLSKQWNTKVTIGSLDFDFFTQLELTDVYIEDRKSKDTLAFMQAVNVDMVRFAPFKNSYALSNVSIETLELHLVRYQGDSLMNIAMLRPAQHNNKEKKKRKHPLSFSVNTIAVNQFEFSLRDSLRNKEHDILIPELDIAVNTLDLEKKMIDIAQIAMNKPMISLKNTPSTSSDGVAEYQFEVPSDWDIRAGDLQLSDAIFYNYAKPRNRAPHQFLFSNFALEEFNIHLIDIHNEENQLAFEIEEGSFVDQTGFQVDLLQANAVLGPSAFSFQNLHLETPQSKIDGSLVFKMNYLTDFAAFIERIRLQANLTDVRLHPKDLKYLFGKSPVTESIFVKGKLNGKVNNLYTEDFELKFEHGSLLRGDIHARGLPDLKNTFFDAQIDQLSTTQSGLANITQKELPEQVTRFGDVSYKGDFLGYLDELVAYGTITTDLGIFNTDVKFSAQNNVPEYSGSLSSSRFQLGNWLDDKTLKDINFSASVQGKEFRLETMNTAFQVDIHSIDYLEHTYNNIEIDGDYKAKLLDVNATLNDDKLKGVIEGTLNTQNDLATMLFTSSIQQANIQELGLSKKPLIIAGNIHGDLTGNDFKKLSGELVSRNTTIITDRKEIEIDSLLLSVNKMGDRQQILLQTESININLEGEYDYVNLPPTILNIVDQYYDFSFKPKLTQNAIQTDTEISFDIAVSKEDELLEVLLDGFTIKDDIEASGILNPNTKELSLLANSKSMSYKDYQVNDWELDVIGTGNLLVINSFQKELIHQDKTWLVGSEVTMEMANNEILTDIRTYNDSFLNAKLSSKLVKQDNGLYNLSVLSSDLIINQKPWSIQKNNSITWGNGTWDAKNFILQNGEQKIHVYNPLEDNASSKLIASLENLSLEDINQLIGFTNKPFEGKLSGKIDMQSISNKNNKLNLALTLDDVMYNHDTVNQTTINGEYFLEAKTGSFTGVVGDRNFQMGIEGFLDLNKEQDILDMTIDIYDAALTPFGNLWASSIKDIEGGVSGYVRIVGGPTKYNLNGEINLIEDMAFTLRFSNTRYTIEKGQKINLSRNRFSINNLQLKDIYQNTANLTGVITHEDLSNFTLDLKGNYQNFMFLNTSKSDNSVFYGTAFAQGNIEFDGPVQDAKMKVKAISMPGTEIFIETGESSSVGEYQFIRFRQPEEDSLKNTRPDQSKLTMLFDLEITPNADVSMRFDPSGYNTLWGNGFGALNINMDTQGEMLMTGYYQVNQGAYVVDLQDVWEREFEILPQSTINWSGNPYDANLNIEAKYSITADASNISGGSSTNLSKVPTDIIMTIKGSLLEPKNEYRIEIGDALVGSSLNNTIQQINDDQTLLDTQVGSLLLLESFTSLNSGIFNRASLNTLAFQSVTSLVTNTLNSLIAEVGLENTTLGIDYENYQRQLDNPNSPVAAGLDQRVSLDISQTFFNDKVRVVVGPALNFGENFDDQANNVFDVGDVVLEFNVDDDRSYEITVFSKQDFNLLRGDIQRRNGIGYIFEKEFNTLKELFEKDSDKKKQKEEEKRKQEPAVKDSIRFREQIGEDDSFPQE